MSKTIISGSYTSGHQLTENETYVYSLNNGLMKYFQFMKVAAKIWKSHSIEGRERFPNKFTIPSLTNTFNIRKKNFVEETTGYI